MATKKAPKSNKKAPKSKLVNGQRINIATGQAMQSSIAKDQSYTHGNTRTSSSGVVTQLPDRISNDKGTSSTLYGDNEAERDMYAAGEAPEQIKTTPEVPQPGQYEVKPGDTLSGIAKAQGVDMKGITGYKSGDPNKIFPGEKLSLGEQFKQGLASMSGNAPASQGEAQAQIGQVMSNIQGQPEPESYIAQATEIDPNLDTNFLDYDEFMSPAAQRTSLVEEYQKLSQSLGIDEINAELIDAKRIIEGTEDDIRSEVTAAGGFATESQVLAMSNARNKSLIKNYNMLLDTRNNAMTQLSTIMDLTVQDRRAAEAEFDRKMNFTFKVAEFKQRAQDNARQTYMTLGNQMGWDTLLGSVSPYEKSIIQKTLGVSGSALNNLALRSQNDRLQKEEEANFERQFKMESLALDREGVSQGWARIGLDRDKLALDRDKALIGDIEDLQKKEAQRVDSANNADTVLTNVNRALKSLNAPVIGGFGLTGLSGRVASLMGNTDTADFRGTLDTIKASLTFDELQKIRQNSPTGGAVGNVSDKDMELLGSRVASLNPKQSAAKLRTSLADIQEKYVDLLHTWGYEYDPQTGDLIEIIDYGY